MLLFWGYPAQDTRYCVNESPAGTFGSCIDLCLGSDSCMLSYGNDTTCILCDIFTVTSITQSDSSENTKLAIKVDQQNQCPGDVQSNQYTKSDPFGNSYELSFNGPDWAVTYPKSCQSGHWRMFPRKIGPFCIWVGSLLFVDDKKRLQVDKSKENPITRNNALRTCKFMVDGGYLAGVTSAAEYNYVLSSSKSRYPNLTDYDYLGIWISGLMKSECESAQVAGCSGINLAFGNDSTCIICDIFTIKYIAQSNYSENTKIAIKVNQQNQCPGDVQSIQYTKSDPYGNNYELSHNGSDWTVTYPKSCPLGGFRMFPRTVGPYCIQVGKTNFTPRNDALATCKKQAKGAAYLSGITSVAEIDYILDYSQVLVRNVTNYDYLAVWISGLMKPECQPTQGAGCSGINAFKEFPGQTTFDYYNFPTGYPNFAMRGTGDVYLRCLQLLYAQQKSELNGKVINAACEYACNEAETICSHLIACGVLAT
ncbi:hypothetical protein CAEBREN_09252 [Caenorhabditis brenneri]|uniref:PAN-3 domain-containing protein n=1 Tax=Caenorhabditis brenneri TaxID=135651 RepID=G0PAU2_CAEBE|nr:hypothetical protein CAEBREN_09252 [Caenorhabditis brenneri]